LAQTAEWASGEEAFWESELDRLELGCLQAGSRAVFLQIEPLTLLPLATQRRMVRRAIQRAKGDLRSIDFGHIEQILELAKRGRGHGQASVPGLSVRRSFGRIRLAPVESAEESADYELSAAVPGSLQIPGTTKEILLQLVDPKEYNEGMGCLDWRRLSGSLKLRSWRDGDRYWPAGSTGEEKIKILFQNARIPVWERRGWPILTAGGAIIWAGQFGPAAQYVADSHSSLVLRILEING
jgi:tRNA(Ile)-lysidine synthase